MANTISAVDYSTGTPIGDYSPNWIYHTIRLALIGSEAMKPTEAVRFCDRYIRNGFVMDYAAVAAEVLYAGLLGHDDDPVEPDEVEEESKAGKAMTEQNEDQTRSV